MKTWLLLCVLLGLTACLVSAKRGSITNGLFQDDIKDDVPAEDTEEEAEPKELEQEKLRANPCHKKKCVRGEICAVTEKYEAECVCTPTDQCERARKSDRYKACSNKNDTYLSECDLDRDHCLCKRDQEGCTRPDARKIHLEYYGACKAGATCVEEEMAQFPRRMREWLFVVMEMMERRSQLHGYETLMEEAIEDSNHTSAVIWKFCDLDTDPQDRYVSRRELQYTVRTLRGLEHCLMPFLDDCDEDDNREISLTEWGNCLEVDHEKINDRCVEIKNKKKKDKKRK